MKQTARIISTYTADVSGVCSALFELGGMTVMHDASGCNSTYNTHDEPRWYDQDSLVFISGLSELEAVMGDDEKLIQDVCAAAADLHPAFIALAGTPIPMLSGCDLPALARSIQARTHIPSFGFATTGMHSYVQGGGAALAAYAGRFPLDGLAVQPGTVNLLGATPLDFSVNGSVSSMIRCLQQGGWQVISCWAMGDRPEALSLAGAASVNLVVSSLGLPAAQVLQGRFHTPYVLGTPWGPAFQQQIFTALEQAAHSGESSAAFAEQAAGDGSQVIIGEAVTARSLAWALQAAGRGPFRVICPLETAPGLLGPGDAALADEEDIQAALAHATLVIADPLYRPILPAACQLIPLPHEAFSGRIFRAQIPNLVESLDSLFGCNRV